MRTTAEWLLLPLFLLPLVVAVGLVAWAGGMQDARHEAYRSDARDVVRAWVTAPQGRAAWMSERVARAFLPGGSGLGDDTDYVAVDHAEGAPRIRLPGHGLGKRTWHVGRALPIGLPLTALADSELRLRLETGTPAAAIEGIDAATAELEALLDAPDLERLRRSGLPTATQAYLIRRWEAAGNSMPGLADAERLLTALRVWEQDLGTGEAPWPVGVRRVGDLLVIDTGTPSPVLLPGGGGDLPVQVFTESAADEEALRLHWVFPADAPTGAPEVWRGDVGVPLGGTFVLTAARGSAWYDAPAMRRYGPFLLALLVLFLALPVFLLAAMRRRRRLDEARVRFINEMAHDLRTPLTSLRLHADLLSEGRGKPERKDAYLATLSRESARLSELLENLLDIARLERGRRAFELTALRVAPLVDQVVEAHAILRPDRGDDVTVSGDPRLEVRADRPALTRVLANLLDNAGKFTFPGTPIHITWSEDAGRIRIEVRDQGSGVPSQERDRIFERYERGAGAKDDGLPGSGLGLALVGELVEGMGGGVCLLPGEEGAAFRVELPGVRDA